MNLLINIIIKHLEIPQMRNKLIQNTFRMRNQLWIKITLRVLFYEDFNVI